MKKELLHAGVFCLLVSGWLSSSLAFAQSDPSGKKRITDTYAITNATVFTAPGQSGVKATVLIKDGLIVGVGSNLSLPNEAKTIAGDSLFIYPGFIDAASDVGITKPKDPERPDDFVSSNPSDEIAGITPWRSAVDQFSIKDSKVDDLRKVGFTIAQIMPDGGMLAGKAAIILLGAENSTNLLKENSGLAASFSGSRGMYPGTAVGVMAKFREIYDNTELSSQRSQKYTTVSGLKRPEITPTYSAMQEVLSGQIPVLFSTSSELEIRRAISLQKEKGFKLVLTGLEDYEEVIDVIKASGASVLVKLEIPDDKAIKAQKDDATEEVKVLNARVKKAYDEAVAQASKLEAAGIPFAFTTVGVKSGDIMKALQTMIKNGLSEKSALAALTTNSASILGISKVAGSIEKGKMANLILSTDSIFAEDSQIKHIVVDGYIYDYDTKAKKKDSKDGKEDGTVKIEGNWEYTSESPAGSSGGILSIQKEGSDYTGTITYDDPSGSGKATSPIKNVVLDGSTLSFSFDVTANGMEILVEVSGEVDSDSFKGTMNVGEFGSFPFEGTLNPTLIANK
ncbi:amidohydrolase family protein [Algoriphagus antarcticus]|uniref:Imidazolonepropionase-like amidohydrolase n=1 Tax=Algoriphagus antarcticus TaxID=238540 RepID=A0A3E0E3F3_9BACT|nr:amidohydrolase family protein [Algoriphagus antarcticus]REG92758.1 imidazolonepropionase-like amidohydrolase [Algoriphagus antarcticus]